MVDGKTITHMSESTRGPEFLNRTPRVTGQFLPRGPAQTAQAAGFDALGLILTHT